MAPENVPIDDYHSRLNALYKTLDSILHPIPKRPFRKWHEEKFVIDPEFAIQIDEVEAGNNQILRFQGCIYFEKLNQTEHKSVTDALKQYACGNDNFAVLPPKFCKNEKRCLGHHNLEDIAANKIPDDLSFCYIYFFA